MWPCACGHVHVRICMHAPMCMRMPIELRLRYRPANKIPQEFLETGFLMMSLARGPNSSLPEATGGPMKPSEVETQVRTWMEDVVREHGQNFIRRIQFAGQGL